MDDQPERRYELPPLERRGVLGQFSGPQLALGAAGVLVLLIGLRSWGASAAGAFGAIALGAIPILLALVPVGGKPLVGWAPIVASYLRERTSGELEFEDSSPFEGTSERQLTDGAASAVRTRCSGRRVLGCEEARAELVGEGAGPLAGVELWALEQRSGTVGIYRDSNRLVAVLMALPEGFVLEAGAEQQQRQDAMGMAFGQCAGSAHRRLVRRVGWVERTILADPDAHVRRLRELASAGHGLHPEPGSLQRYLQMLETTSERREWPVRHEVLVPLQVDVSWKSAAKEARRLASGEPLLGGMMLACRELRRLAGGLVPAGAKIAGQLTPALLSDAVRDSFDPPARRSRGRWRAALKEHARRPDTLAGGPRHSRERRAVFESDGAFHQTLWIKGWPQLRVGPRFLSPMMLAPGLVRSIAVCIEPVPAALSVRSVEEARVADEAAAITRSRRGILTTERQRRQRHAAVQREQELSAGWREARFAGFVTCSGGSPEELEDCRDELVGLAGQCGLELDPLSFQQGAGFLNTLPLCRGLADA